jgi:DNA repair protein RecO (recombination protein O)
MITHKTKGLVLRSVKYGETSLVVTVFTELFGLQSYMVNGVRAVSKKGGSKAVYFQPGSLLDLIVYHNELKNLQRIKEYKWSYLYKEISSDVIKNSVAVFMIELLGKCLKEPEPNEELFGFIEDALFHLDHANKKVTANFPAYFALHLAVFFGFRITDDHSAIRPVLDLREGIFISERPSHPYILEGKEAEGIADILKVLQPADLEELDLNNETRRNIIAAIETYYALHISEFGTMKTLPVLRELSS